MDTESQASHDRPGPVGGGHFSLVRASLWFGSCFLVAAVIARIALIAQSYFAPIIIFPLLVGIALATLLVGLMRIEQVGHRPTVLVGLVAAVVVVVVGQHYFAYRAAGVAYKANAEKVAMIQQAFPGEISAAPLGLRHYMQQQAVAGRPLLGEWTVHGATVWLTWVADALLILVASIGLMIPAMRLPFCNGCHSWYRVVQSGRIDVALARRLADATGGRPVVDAPIAARYRLLRCNAGCGVTGFELAWDESSLGALATRVWIDAATRRRVEDLLNQK